MVSNLLLVPFIYCFNVAEHHFIFAIPEIVRHRDVTLRIPHGLNVIIHELPQVLHVRLLRVHELLQHEFALPQPAIDSFPKTRHFNIHLVTIEKFLRTAILRHSPLTVCRFRHRFRRTRSWNFSATIPGACFPPHRLPAASSPAAGSCAPGFPCAVPGNV